MYLNEINVFRVIRGLHLHKGWSNDRPKKCNFFYTITIQSRLMRVKNEKTIFSSLKGLNTLMGLKQKEIVEKEFFFVVLYWWVNKIIYYEDKNEGNSLTSWFENVPNISKRLKQKLIFTYVINDEKNEKKNCTHMRRRHNNKISEVKKIFNYVLTDLILSIAKIDW